jgi:palmitoyl-protein thioesterase
MESIMKKYGASGILFTLLFSVVLQATSGLHKKTIILVHGFLTGADEMQPTADRIQAQLPDAYIKIVNLGLGKWTSFFNMFDQAEWLKIELASDPNITDDCVMIAHSQGGLVARYYVERYNLPKIKKLITWGTPHQGIFGSPGFLDRRFSWLNVLELYAYKLFYMYPMQKYISIASYWRDPLHHEEYLDQCLFLPHANNEIPHIYHDVYKENIESLEQFVVLKSNKEDIITPAESCHFGFYYEGSNRHIEPFLESKQYTDNLMGLKTLYDQGKLIFKSVECSHYGYLSDESVFMENTLPYIR